MVGYAGAAAFGRIARPRLAASGRNPAAARAPWYRLRAWRNPEPRKGQGKRGECYQWMGRA